MVWAWLGGLNALRAAHNFMICDLCKNSAYRLHHITGSKGQFACGGCWVAPMPVTNDGILGNTYYIDKQNGVEKPMKTTIAELNHIRNFNPKDHNGQLGY